MLYFLIKTYILNIKIHYKSVIEFCLIADMKEDAFEIAQVNYIYLFIYYNIFNLIT